MILGGYTFDGNPSRIPSIIRQKKAASYVETYTSVGFFDWGSTYIGQRIDMEWDFMPADMYDSLETLYLLPNTIHVFNPEDGEAVTFSVHILSLDCTYFISVTDWIDDSSASSWRKDVKMSLVIAGVSA